ncbi:MAG: U32 family peptidase [Prevotella sp.]|nr:U32 family peptidase [Prevotella sp.]
MRKIELLAPAKDLKCGIAAIAHGADAVYIGAQRFGARAAAGNSVEDIEQLCRYAHRYAAKVYVTVNTIIYDNELEDTRRLLDELKQAGVDAVLVQDMSLVPCSPLPLHASTQTDNRTVEKVRWLRSLGFSRVVLARELSLAEIKAIHKAVPDVELEVFVHGALCVSYSGQCYASQYCFGRSANRGECAQFCRLKFNLEDADGNTIDRNRYLLSLKDMCRIDHLEQLVDAGVTSFKIEGRLKDVTYVKNVVAAYSTRLNQIIEKSGGRLARASMGSATYTFTPNLKKTFNRGFTDYFLNGRTPDIASPDTPKAIGEFVGKVKEISRRGIRVAGTSVFANGDGLCYVNGERELEGFRVNRVENNLLIPAKTPRSLRVGMSLYRNNDQLFEHELQKHTAERKIPVSLVLGETDRGFSLTMQVVGSEWDSPIVAMSFVDAEKQEAQTPQRDNYKRLLSRLGDTPFVADSIEFEPSSFSHFIPSSVIAALRRDACERLEEEIGAVMHSHETTNADVETRPLTVPPVAPLPYLYNISNRLAREFYEKCGAENTGEAFELRRSALNVLIMQCRHCLRYSYGYCVKNGGKRPMWKEPLRLVLPDGRRFPLQFDCKNCQMNVYAE